MFQGSLFEMLTYENNAKNIWPLKEVQGWGMRKHNNRFE